MKRNDDVVQLLTELVQQHSADVDLLVAYGSWLNGDDGPRSDVDLFFVPADEAGWELARTFILEDVGYDLFAMSWSRLELIADLGDLLLPLVSHGRVLHAAPGAEQRYARLGQRLRARLADPDWRHSEVDRRVRHAAGELATITARPGRLGLARESAAELVQRLAEAVALHQGQHFERGLKHLYDDLAALPALPDGFLEQLDAVLGAPDGAQLQARAASLLQTTAAFVDVPVPVGQPSIDDRPEQVSAAERAGWLEELWSSFAKLDRCAQAGDWRTACLVAAGVQRSARQDAGLVWEPTLLEHFSRHDLAGLAALGWSWAEQTEAELNEQGVELQRFSDLGQLRGALLG